MRKFSKQGSRELTEVRCNCCGRRLTVEHGIIKEGCAAVELPFGFFSDKGGQVHDFDLCEDCYDIIISGFEIPVEIKEKTEFL